MREEKLFNYPFEKSKTISLDKENIIEYIDKLDIKYIRVFDSLEINDTVKYIYTDMAHPVTYSDFFIDEKALSINSEYLKNNSDYVNDIIVETVKHLRGEVTICDTSLITDEVVDAISNNPNLTKITLGNISDIYYLNQETYSKLNNGHIKKIVTNGVDKSLEDNFDEIIDYNWTKDLIGGYRYDELKVTKRINLSLPIKDELIKDLKYSQDGVTVDLWADDYSSIFDCIDKIRSLNKGYTYNIHINEYNKEHFNKYLFSLDNIVSNDICIIYQAESYPINEYLKNEKYLYQLIEPAIGLSNFEKYLYAYNIDKHYKKYQEAEDKLESRDVYRVINNDEYMVCVGYSDLLIDLLNKLDIQSYYYSVGVEVGFDDIDVMAENVENENESKRGGHARIIVHLKDPKYNVDGIYIADPTWDNVLEEDSYTYSALTFEEITHTKRYNYQDNDITGLLFSQNIKQFYNGVNKFIDKKVSGDEYAFLPGVSNETAQRRFLDDIVDLIKQLDKDFYQNIELKYQEINNNYEYFNQQVFSEIMTDIGYYILSKNNNPLNIEQYREAIRVLYTNYYGLTEEEVNREVNRTIQYNKDKFEESFPTIYKINASGEKEIYSNLENKWEDNNTKQR